MFLCPSVPLLTAQSIIIHSKRGATIQTGTTIIGIGAARRWCRRVCPLATACIDIWIKSHQQWLRIYYFPSLDAQQRTGQLLFKLSFPAQKVKHDANGNKYQFLKNSFNTNINPLFCTWAGLKYMSGNSFALVASCWEQFVTCKLLRQQLKWPLLPFGLGLLRASTTLLDQSRSQVRGQCLRRIA